MGQRVFIVITAFIVQFLLLGCDNPGYTPIIKEVLTPMQKELVSFYRKNHRFPNSNECNVLLANSGCKIKNNYCYYKGKRFQIESEISYDYIVILKLKNSDCLTGLFKNGGVKPIGCQLRGTMSISH